MATTLTPGAVLGSAPGAAVTVLTNQKGRPLSKSATLDSEGRLQVRPSAQLSQGTFRVAPAASITELAQVISTLSTSEALAHGLPKNGAQSGVVVSAEKLGQNPGALTRSLENFGWGAGPGWLMLDADLKELPPEIADDLDLSTLENIRAVLCGAVSELATAPMVGLSSAGAMLYRKSDGKLLRGLTGARFYVPVERARDIPEIGRRLFDRLVLAGLGYAHISKSGRVSIRTLIDVAVWSPERLDFIGGAACGEGVEQRRGEPIPWNADSKTHFSIDAFSPDKTSRLTEITAELLDSARERAAAVRAEYVKARAAEGKTVVATEDDSGLVYLGLEHDVEMADGTCITIADILTEPEKYHGLHCREPMEPEYAPPDGQIAKIFVKDQRSGPIIRSLAHGGINYALGWGGPVPSATDDFALDGASPEPEELPAFDQGASDMQHLAALTGDAEAAFFSDLPSNQTGALARWDEAQEATTRSHPLTKVFAEVVLPAALAASTRTPRTFRFTFRQVLARNEIWRALSYAEREQLTQAAQVLLTKYTAGGRMRPLKEVPPIAWLVKDFLLTSSLSAIVGPTNVGKSWVALDLACLVASSEGSPLTLDGRTVEKHGTVWYCTSEDAYGIIRRKEAWERANHSVPRLHIFSGMPLLSAPHEETVALLRSVAKDTASAPVLIIIDVFTDAVAGDDNTAEVIAPAMQRARAIAEMFDASMLIVHHANKADPKDPRGSSAFKNAVDVLCAVSMDAAGIHMTWEKARSTPKGKDFHFHIRRDGVLQNGAALSCGESGALSEGEMLARVAARELRKIETPATSADWAAAVMEAVPSSFGEKVTLHYRRTKLSRARKQALDNKWAEKDKNNRYIVGPVTVPEDAMELGCLDDVEALI